MDIQAAFRITAGVVGQQAVDKLNAGVGKLNESVGKVPTVAKAAGLAIAGLGAGLSAAVFKEKFDGVVEGILRVKDAAEKTGSSIEQIGGLFQAAKITGDDFGLIEGAIIKLDKALHGADDGAKGAARALEFLGLKASDLRKMDPAQAFTVIAQSMAKVEDGSGKTALAMDLFGKSGAQVLPFLKDYAEIGEQVSKVTKKQTDDAEAYQRAVLRLKAAKEETYKTIAVAVLPVATQFVEALKDTAAQGNAAKGAIKELAANNTLRDWAQNSAMAVAILLESLTAVAKGIYAVVGSFRAVWADLTVAGTFAKNGGVVGLAWKSNRDELSAAVDERNKILEDANKRYDELWNYDGTKLSRNLRERFDLMNAGAGAGRGSGDDPRRTDKPKNADDYTTTPPTIPKLGGEKSDPYGNALDALGQDAAKLQEQIAIIKQYGDAVESAKGAQARYQVESGKFKDVSEKQKIALVMQADAVDRLAEEYKNLKTAAEITKQTEAIDANTASLGLNTRERELAAFSQDLENRGIKRGTELYQQLTDARRAALERKDSAENDPMLGLKRGLNDIADQAKGTGTLIRDALTSSFDRAGDALAEFVTTGKFNFKSFAAEVLADLAKMIAKQAVFNAVKAGMSALGFADGGAFDGGRQAFATGGIVNSPTPFRFASGGRVQNGLMGEAGPEAIMPLKRGTDGKLGVAMTGGGGGGDVNIGSIVVQTDGTTSANDPSGKNGAALARQLTQVVQAEIIRQQRPGGLLAAA